VAGATVHSLALLVSKSLLRRLPSGRYEIHELVRQYGEEHLKQVGQHEEAQERCCTYYADFLDAQWDVIKAAMHNAAFERIDAELINITIAFQAMIDHRANAQIERSMNPLWAYCAIRSRFSEGALMFGHGADVLRTEPNNPLLASLLLRHAVFTACLGAYRAGDQAKRLADEGLALLRQQDEVGAETLILAYFCSGIVHWLAGDSQRMRDAAQLGLDYAAAADHALGTRLNLCLLGRAEFKLSNFSRASEIGHTCYDLAASANDIWVQGFIAFNVLTEVAFVEQEYEEAQHWCQIAQQCFEDLHEPWTLATTLMLTVCAVALQDFDAAQRHLNACLHMLEESGLIWQVPAIALRVARLLAEQQMIEYAVGTLAQVTKHPMCRDKTRGEAAVLLEQLKGTIAPERYARAWELGQVVPLDQLFEWLTRLRHLAAESAVPPGPLSDRELDVLRLIADGLSNAEIAERLYLAIGTVKVHIKHIFDKLDVKSRTEAVKRARELGILSG
jgi:ATP/maltotriose-dependent transcriptional regulator MalT